MTPLIDWVGWGGGGVWHVLKCVQDSPNKRRIKLFTRPKTNDTSHQHVPVNFVLVAKKQTTGTLDDIGSIIRCDDPTFIRTLIPINGAVPWFDLSTVYCVYTIKQYKKIFFAFVSYKTLILKSSFVFSQMRDHCCLDLYHVGQYRVFTPLIPP